MKQYLPMIAVAVIAVLLTVIIMPIFIKSKSNDEVWKNEVKHLEEDKKELKEQVVILTNERDQLRYSKDSTEKVLLTQSSRIEVRYKNIPVYVRSLSDDELQRAIERRFPNSP